MAGRTPLEVGVLRVRRRAEVLLQELGLLVLPELQRQALDGEVLVAGDRGHGVGRGAEGVHQDQRQRGVVLLAEVQHLARDHVEEGQPAAHAQQRLGAVHAHRGAQAAVELDDGGGADRVGGDLRRRPRRRPATPCRAARSRTPGSCRSRRARAAGSSGRRSRPRPRPRPRPASSGGPGSNLDYPCFDRRLAAWSERQSPPSADVQGYASANAAKVALRDQLVTARNRRSLLEVGDGRAGDRASTCWRRRRYAARPPWRRTSRSAPSPAPPPSWTACVGLGKRVVAARRAARPRPRLGGVPGADRRSRPRGAACSSPSAPGSASTPSPPPTSCWCPASRSRRTGDRMGRAAAATTAPSARVPVGTPVWVLLYDDEVGLDVPVEPHDRKVTGAVTPSGLVRLRPAG